MSYKPDSGRMKHSTYEIVVLIVAAVCVLAMFAFKMFSGQTEPDKVIVYTVQENAGDVSPAESEPPEALPDAINLNTADAETLATLPGIGESKAAAIVAYREANGGFRQVEDLLKVEGIGQKTLDKIRDRVYVDEK